MTVCFLNGYCFCFYVGMVRIGERIKHVVIGKYYQMQLACHTIVLIIGINMIPTALDMTNPYPRC